MDLALEKKVFYHNIRIVSFNTMVLALVYIGAIYLMINKSSLLEDTLAFIGDQLFSPLGIIMFVRTALYELEYKTSEMVYSKIYPYWRSILYRIIIISIQLFLVLSIAFVPLKFFRVDFNLVNILFGSFVTSFFLGIIGMILGYITNEVSVGVLIPFLYYFFEMFSKGKYTKGYYLFGMIVGNYASKIRLFSIAIFLVILIMIVIKKQV